MVLPGLDRNGMGRVVIVRVDRLVHVGPLTDCAHFVPMACPEVREAMADRNQWYGKPCRHTGERREGAKAGKAKHGGNVAHVCRCGQPICWRS